MSLHFGYEQKDEVEDRPRWTYQLEYPKASLNTAMYSVRNSGGYRYMSTEDLTSKTYLTLVAHSFGTSVGVNVTNLVIKYSIEFLHNSGSSNYYNLETIKLKKIPKSGKNFNILDLKDYPMFLVYFTQLSGTVSNDTSTLDVYF